MRPTLLAASLVLFASIPGWVHAQVKLAIFDEDKSALQNVVFQEASARADYQHGRVLRITLNGDKQIKGVLVRTDRKNNRIFVRTEPGSPPRAIPVADIKAVEKGVIRQVNYTGDVTLPEIQRLVIQNGGRRTVTYNAPTLSPGEITRLNELEIAENELTRLEDLQHGQLRLEERVLAAEVAVLDEQRRTHELVNQMLWRQLAPSAYSIYLPVDSVYMGTTQYYPGQAMFAMPWMTNPLLTAAMPMPVVRPAQSVTTRVIVAPEAITSARRTVLAAQSHVIFENRELVAVIIDEPGK